MDDLYKILKSSKLFEGISEKDFKVLSICISLQEKEYAKGEYIHAEGDRIDQIGIVLQGSVHVVKEDYYGNRTIIGLLGAGEVFGAACAAFKEMGSPESIVAVENTKIASIDYKRILTVCPIGCKFHNHLVQNMLKVVAEKNIMLQQKLELISRKTTREKLLAYLSDQAKKAQNPYFSIPLKRQELADYLGVDRSAMSTELGKMKAEGIIDFERSHFKLL